MKWEMPKPNLVVFIALLALALYDLALVCFFDTTSSISAFMVKTGFKSPLIVFTIGAICGHLFFYMKQREP